VPVVAITEDENINAAGELDYVYTITFTVADRPGSFTVTVPKSGDPVEAARQAIAQVEADVTGIYAIP
jgi:hypothetical protein